MTSPLSSSISAASRKSSKEILPLVYDELRKLAAIRMSKENPGQTLSATALVHSAYERLVDRENSVRWDSRGHFFAAAAEAMRRILVENARRKKAVRHGGLHQRLDLGLSDHFQVPDSGDRIIDVLDFDDALKDFQKHYPLKAKLVELRFFAG